MPMTRSTLSFRGKALIVSLALTACGSYGSSLSFDRLSAVPTTQLWSEHRLAASRSDRVALLRLEAELASRGSEEFGTQFIGSRTAMLIGTSTFPRSETAIADDRDCADFASSLEAQRFFLSQGGPQSDPHRLDADGDGHACEWGVEVRRISRDATRPIVSPAPSYTPQRPSGGSRCYTGPRGGTYTITASGNRNYDGC